jgi:hypothetical protein
MTTGPDSKVPDLTIWSGSLTAGVWHRFVVMVRPSFADASGEVALTVDETTVVDWTGSIGYDPAMVPGAQPGIDTKFGIYQPDTNVAHSVFFDDVVFADPAGSAP